MQVVDLFTGEHFQPAYDAINPNHLVPMLEDGDFRLTESSAILKYLADKADSPLYPQGSAGARAGQRAHGLGQHAAEPGPGLRSRLSADPPQPQAAQRRSAGGHAAMGQGARADLAEGARRAHPRPGQRLPVRRQRSPSPTTSASPSSRWPRPPAAIFAAYPNVRRWLGRMKSLKSWQQVNEAIDGFARVAQGQPDARDV